MHAVSCTCLVTFYHTITITTTTTTTAAAAAATTSATIIATISATFTFDRLFI